MSKLNDLAKTKVELGKALIRAAEKNERTSENPPKTESGSNGKAKRRRTG